MEIMKIHLLQLNNIGMDRFRPVRRKQRYGTHDQDNVLVRAPLFIERPDEALVLLVHVTLGQL